MALKITDECTSCSACEPECPNGAISEGDGIFVINPDLCTECVGFHDTMQCADVCPVDCCVPDEARPEGKDQLVAKVKKIHPDEDFGDNPPSHLH